MEETDRFPCTGDDGVIYFVVEYRKILSTPLMSGAKTGLGTAEYFLSDGDELIDGSNGFEFEIASTGVQLKRL